LFSVWWRTFYHIHCLVDYKVYFIHPVRRFDCWSINIMVYRIGIRKSNLFPTLECLMERNGMDLTLLINLNSWLVNWTNFNKGRHMDPDILVI